MHSLKLDLELPEFHVNEKANKQPRCSSSFTYNNVTVSEIEEPGENSQSIVEDETTMMITIMSP